MITTILSWLVVVAIVVAFYLLLRPTVQTVDEGWRRVIYLLGHVNRFAGPGPILVFEGVERVDRDEEVRNKPLYVVVDGLFPRDIPLNATVNLWAQYDPRAVTRSRDELHQLLLLPPGQRNEQMRVYLRDALIRQTRAVNEERKLPADAWPVDKILPAIPGSSWHEDLLNKVAQDVAPLLTGLGVILDRSKPLKITQIEIPEADRKAFTTDRLAAMLSARFPGLSAPALAQLLAGFMGESPLHVQDIRLDGPAAGSAYVENRSIGPDGTVTTVGVPPAAGATTAGAAAASATAPTPSEPQHLSKSDLQVLKPVPRAPGKPNRAA
jgi:hypothetical protein